MSIYIHNSLTRKKEEFIPLKPQEVKMYVCGPTVYDQPHIGHARSAYIFDVIRRYLTYKGYKVKFVRNVTDVDDKIIDKARKEFPSEDLNIAFKKVADKYLVSYHLALESLGIGRDLDEIDEPKASEYIPKMILFIQGLIDKGAAYASAGDVYFDITKAKDYGKLSNQALEKMESGVRVSAAENKRDPLDFALWKSAKENEPSWESPWGKGRPGWHIECSVMSSDILGDEFDIHGGGVDLIFPHHENEIAQSEGLGKKFARYWIHHGLLTINSQKMAKSLGNFITVQDFLDKHKNANLLKLLFLSTHYSHPVDYTEEKIKEAEQSAQRISILLGKIEKYGAGCKMKGLSRELNDLKNKFMEAMDDDFNMPQALACVFELVNIINKNIEDSDFAGQGKDLLLELSGILGLEWKKPGEEKNISAEEKSLIDKRNSAKKERNFAEADRIRKELESKGIILEDTKNSTAWRRKQEQFP